MTFAAILDKIRQKHAKFTALIGPWKNVLDWDDYDTGIWIHIRISDSPVNTSVVISLSFILLGHRQPWRMSARMIQPGLVNVSIFE